MNRERHVEPVFAPPSRHSGSRVVVTPPDLVRSLSGVRSDVAGQASRIRREDLTFAPADPARGEPCTSGSFVDVLVTMTYRSGHALYVDLAMGTGSGSVMQARLAVPDLGLVGDAVSTPSGGTERDIRITMPLNEVWPMGEAHRVYVQARRVSGSDSTTVRALRAWQR